MTQPPLPITGMAVCTALGSTLSSNRDALWFGQHGLRPPSIPLPFETVVGEIVSILGCAAAAMGPDTELFIMETFVDRQRYPAAEFCLHATSLYFTCMANGNSRMYSADDMKRFVAAANLKIVAEHDELGVSHARFRCVRSSA